jgi:small subunit ribosomal protein S1
MSAEQNGTASDTPNDSGRLESAPGPDRTPAAAGAAGAPLSAVAVHHDAGDEDEDEGAAADEADESVEVGKAGEESSASTLGAEPGASGVKKKRRRRRKKSDAGASSAGDVVAPEGEGAAVAAEAPAGPRKEAQLPFQRFFEGRETRRHGFAVGDIVAGRVTRVEHGAAVIDLFGKATAFARANEPREVPIPSPGKTEAEEPEESATLPSAGAELAPSEGEEGAPCDAAPVADADGSGFESAAPSDAEAEAPEEAPAVRAESEVECPPLEVGTIFRGRVAAIAESGHIAIYNTKIVTRAEARARLQAARDQHRRVFGLVYGFNRGGFDVLVEGVRAFCPVSGMTLDPVDDPETLLGRFLEFSVQQAKSGHQGIVVSRRSILEREARKRARELRRTLQPGQRIKGRVTQVREFGLFVDLGGIEGLVHLSELSWDRGVKPGDVARPGEEIEVQVLRVSEPHGRKERDGRIALSIKTLTPDPWETKLDGIEEGVPRKGRVTRAAEFGAFVELAPGIEGLLHVTELGRDLKHASAKVKEGDELYVVVERIDRKARRISLSKLSDQDARLLEAGQLECAPGGKIVRPGAHLKVRVERVESAGVFVQVEGVLGRRGRGFIPNAEMDTERGTDHRKKFPPGTELEVKVIGFDREGGLRLSRKAFCADEERRAVQDYRREAASKGFGTFGDLLRHKLGGSVGGDKR